MQKDKLVFKFSVLPFVLLSCCSWMNKAQANSYLPPRLSLDANAGGSATVGQADLLLSLKGDERRNLYLDPQAAYGTDEQWYTDLGLGYRWIQNDAAILGGYIFAGHSQVANQNGFWIANPGVEAMGSRWDARINGYIPIGSRQDDMGIVRFNQSSRLVFSGHSESRITRYVYGDELQEIGDGVDAKVGYQVLRGLPLKAYLGAYFFGLNYTSNVRGGAAGLEYWFDHKVKVFANYTYDNLQHSTVVGGLAVSFGGVDESRADPSLSERLTDPVERYLANLGHGSGIPSQTMLKNLQTGVERVLKAGNVSTLPGGDDSEIIANNIAYFSRTGSPNGTAGLTMANCTFENPCGPADFTQANVNTLNSLLPNTEMFFNGGNYNAANGTSALTLNNGQSVWGTSGDYTPGAQGAARSIFDGAFILTGNNTLDSIILGNNLTLTTVAITSTNAPNLVFNNVLIGNLAAPLSYSALMSLTNSSATVMGGSVLQDTNANLPFGNFTETGLLLTGSTLNVQSSSITITSTINNTQPSLDAIILTNGSTLVLSDSDLTVNNSVIGTLTSVPFVFAISAFQGSTVTINNNSNINMLSAPPAQQSTGTFAALSTVDTVSTIEMVGGTITMNGATISVTAPTDPSPPPVNITLDAVTCFINSTSGVTCS